MFGSLELTGLLAMSMERTESPISGSLPKNNQYLFSKS